MKIKYVIIVTLVIFFIGCKNQDNFIEKDVALETSKTEYSDSLYILATEDFFVNSLNDTLSKKFAMEFNTRLIWENGGNKREIYDIFDTASFEYYPDIVLGISNVFYKEWNDINVFEKLRKIFFSNVRKNSKFDKKSRFVPYEYSYLVLVGKTDSKTRLPLGFGELQKEDYFNDLVLSDAINTEYGRALFNNIEAIFRYHGFLTCWYRLEGAILKIENDDEKAINTFLDSEPDKMIFLPVSELIPSFGDKNKSLFSYQYPQEGTYKIIHGAAVTSRSTNKEKAYSFILSLLNDKTQALIVKNNNWLPVNEVADKSENYKYINFPSRIINDKINFKNVNKYLELWLKEWKSYSLRLQKYN